MPTISITLENGFQGMLLQKLIIVPDTFPTPRMASWFETVSCAHVPGAIKLAKLPSAVFARGGGAGGVGVAGGSAILVREMISSSYQVNPVGWACKGSLPVS